MNRKDDEIRNLTRRVQSLEPRLVYANESREGMRKRIQAEYAKHIPNVTYGHEDLRLGNTPTGRALFTCQECTFEFWPCKAWHTLRRIYGWDTAQYEHLTLQRKEDA